MKLKEDFKYKDGVWILYYGHLNSDEFKVAVYQNGEKVEERSFLAGRYKKGDIESTAKKFSEEYDLPIINGTKVGWNVFRNEYVKSDAYDLEDGVDAEIYDYSDEELDAMDSREKQTTKWAICQGPNLFKIYDNVQKNPDRLWDTDMHRGLFSYSVKERIQDLEEFFEKHAEEVYEGTWEDLKDSAYVVVVNGRVYESRNIEKLFNQIVDAGFEINGNEILGQLDIIKDSEEGEVISFNFSKVDLDYWWDGEKFNVKKIITAIYDCLTCIGQFFPEELTIEFNDGQYTVAIIDQNISIGATEKYETLKNVQIGDVLREGRPSDLSSYGAKFVVVRTNGKQVVAVQCSKYEKDYYWQPRQYVDGNLYQAILEGKHKGNEVTIDLVDSRGWMFFCTKEEVEKAIEKATDKSELRYL